MAYSDIQQTEFNRATENLVEITWTYVNLQKEFPKLSETDSMGWKQMFVVWANEFEENYGRTDWDESEKTYQEAIEEFAKEKIFQWVGIRKYICIGRHIEGITLNPYEWLMEKGRKVKLFENEVEAKALKSARYAARNWRIKMDDIILKITAEIVITQEDVDDIMSTALDSSTLQCWCSEVNVVGRYLGEYASEQISRGGELELYEIEEETYRSLTLENFKTGLIKYFSEDYMDSRIS